MPNIKKAIGKIALAISGIGAAVMALPQNALALGWGADDMVAQTTGTTGMTAASINQTTLANWVYAVTTFLLGIAIVIFVLKVVLTAIDRMILAKPNGNGTYAEGSHGIKLSGIPVIGAYEPGVAWKDVFINFGKNVAIVAGAWVLVQIVVGIILFVFGMVTQVS